MRNRLAIVATIIALASIMTSCGVFKSVHAQPGPTTTTTPPTTVTADPLDGVIATLGDWQTMQTGGNIKLNAGSSFSSSIQVRMVRDKAIFISLRPMLGIEVGKLIITADSLYAVDKIHKRYVAEKVSILTSGVPVTVSDVQDMFLGRPFIIGQGTLNEQLKPEMTADTEGSHIVLTPIEKYKGYGYAFTFDNSLRIKELNIIPEGSSTAAYQVKYSDAHSTKAGNIAHAINIDATVEKKKAAFSLNYKDIEWNGKVNIDFGIPNNYQRMNAKDLFSLFSN